LKTAAAENYLRPFLYYKGFHALQCHRIGHWLWRDGRRELAHFLQSRVSQVLAIDIHLPCLSGVACLSTTVPVPLSAKLRSSTTTFLILHELTLGGTGKERGDRHPKVRDSVLLCAGAKVLGNVEIGQRLNGRAIPTSRTALSGEVSRPDEHETRRPAPRFPQPRIDDFT
jgi:serine O-acetyltransferase